MHEEGFAPTIVLGHDAKALYERGPVVTGGHAFVEVINQNKVGVANDIRLFHHPYAPVIVG